MSSATAVTAVRSAEFDEFLAAEMRRHAAAMSGTGEYFHVIYKVRSCHKSCYLRCGNFRPAAIRDTTFSELEFIAAKIVQAGRSAKFIWTRPQQNPVKIRSETENKAGLSKTPAAESLPSILQMVQITVTHKVFVTLCQIGLSVCQHIEPVRYVGHMAIHVIGKQDAFILFSARIKAFKVTTCNGATCEKVRRALRKAPAAQNNETLQNTPLPAGKGSDFRLPQLPEYRKPDRQVIPLQTEVPQNRLHSQPPGVNPAAEDNAPGCFRNDRTICRRCASIGIRGATLRRVSSSGSFSTAIASQQCRCSAGFDGKIYTRKNHPTTERQLDRIYFENMFSEGSYSTRDTNISSI